MAIAHSGFVKKARYNELSLLYIYGAIILPSIVPKTVIAFSAGNTLYEIRISHTNGFSKLPDHK